MNILRTRIRDFFQKLAKHTMPLAITVALLATSAFADMVHIATNRNDSEGYTRESWIDSQWGYQIDIYKYDFGASFTVVHNFADIFKGLINPDPSDSSSGPKGSDPSDPASVLEWMAEHYGKAPAAVISPFWKIDAIYGITPSGGIIPIHNPSDDDDSGDPILVTLTAIAEEVAGSGGLAGLGFDGQGEDASWFVLNSGKKGPPPSGGDGSGDASTNADANDAGYLVYVGEGSDFVHPKAQGMDLKGFIMLYSTEETSEINLDGLTPPSP